MLNVYIVLALRMMISCGNATELGDINENTRKSHLFKIANMSLLFVPFNVECFEAKHGVKVFYIISTCVDR